MNRQTLTIGAGLLALVVVAFGIAVYLERGGSDDAAAISGPGRATEAREIIADIQQRRANDSGAAAARTAPAPIDQPATEAEPANGQAAGVAATAVTPAPDAAAAGGSELDAAFERARALQAAGQLDDAQVLYFFGARQGHAPSAFAYAEMNDPNHHSPETSLLAEPDAFQAFRWYSVALDGGMDAAAARLDALHEWARKAAEAGDADAERLLLQWE
jgi:hypothetical protein